MSLPINPEWIEAAHAAVVAAMPNYDENTSRCLMDEDECFAAHPLHFAWQQNGQVGVMGETRALAEVVLAAVMPLFTDHNAAS